MSVARSARPLGRATLQTDDPASLLARIATLQPRLIVNCAAHTDVDSAENDPQLAQRVNADLPALLAEAARRHDALLVQISSTGVYGAWSDRPYDERDRCQPTTVHHRSKLAGEQAVSQSGCKYLILRTGWLFSGPANRPRNFVWHRLREARDASVLRSDPVQRGNPTCATDLAALTLRLVDLGVHGIYNSVGEEPASRLDYVREIVAAAGLPCRVEPAAGQFTRRAPVSCNEAAVNWGLGQLGLTTMPPWRESLRRYVQQLMADATI